MTQPNGSRECINSLNIKAPQIRRRCPWLLILRGEANEWWQWLRRTHTEAGTAVTWEVFSEELWSRFEPTDSEDFDESLSKIHQTGDLRDYQREFERLGNRVRGWTQKALVGTFMGGLNSEISEGIRMFKPKTLKDAISLARMKDEQLLRQKAIRPSFQMSSSSLTKIKPSTPVWAKEVVVPPQPALNDDSWWASPCSHNQLDHKWVEGHSYNKKGMIGLVEHYWHSYYLMWYWSKLFNGVAGGGTEQAAGGK
ncbi:hypothetical protein GH714_028188 [Hevea brasiliensis]|uniref:Retrotransposon gag domain-containing protein n=1 Tax=Hevea brasiliensis TaxID=3981 RepID=A0A6A6N547_HEVBR|nr:hypothetical protein GH714_028188 [Hevea brasiliensis]